MACFQQSQTPVIILQRLFDNSNYSDRLCSVQVFTLPSSLLFSVA